MFFMFLTIAKIIVSNIARTLAVKKPCRSIKMELFIKTSDYV